MGAFNLIGPAMQGARTLSNLKTLLLGGGPVGAVSLGVGLAPQFNKAAQDNPTKSARMSILGSTGTNLAGSSAVRGPSRKTEGYTSYGTYKVGDIEYDMASGRPVYMPPGSVYPSSSIAPLVTPAAKRSFESEKSRIAQLTAQDPELQRYENARKAAKTQEEMNAARDIGMQIWQQKYGNTPMGQPGGAVGVRNPLMDRTFGYQTGSAPDQQMGAPTLGPSPLVPQVDQSLNPASPNYIGGEGAPLMDFTRDEVNPELIAAYQKQLLEQASAGRK